MFRLSSKFIFYASLTFLLLFGAFSYGIFIGSNEYWPYNALKTIKNHIVTLVKKGEFAPEGRVIVPAKDAPRERFTIHDGKNIIEGYYALMGWDSTQGSYVIWLYDNRGEQLHRWVIDYSALDADGPRNNSDTPHGMQMLEDGSVVVNFDKGDVMARLDACSKPIWIKKGVFHHVIDRDDNGDLWAWRGDGTAYGDRQFIVRFDTETGRTLQEIDFNNDVIKASGEESYIFSVRADHEFHTYEEDPPYEKDMFHPNDIEVLPSSLADKFEGFSAGDLLLSFRQLDLVAVLDPNVMRIKWWNRGPWSWQHDPDFTIDGKISVFDNNSYHERSEILMIDPVTKEVSNNLVNGNVKFYTQSMGKHTYLSNGNILIVSPGEGRAIEVTASGDKVLEFNNVANEEFNAHIENGVWLPTDFYSKIPACAN